MEEEKKEEQKIVPQEETEEKVETVEQLETKEEPVKEEQPSQEESAEQPKEEPPRMVVDLDYDKLAEAIVRAQIKVEQEKQKEAEHTERVFGEIVDAAMSVKISFGERIKRATNMFLGKDDVCLRTDILISSTASYSLQLISLLIRFFSLFIILGVVLNYVQYDWTGMNIATGIVSLLMILSIVLVMNLYAGIIRIIAKKLQKEMDRSYVITVFSALSGFIALMVACIALLVSRV